MKCTICNNTNNEKGFEDIFNSNIFQVVGYVCKNCGHVLTFSREFHMQYLKEQVKGAGR